MWRQTLFVFVIISSAETVKNLQTETSYSTMELMSFAQCEAQCYSIEEDERESTLKRANTTKEDTKTTICFEGLNIPVFGPECSQLCNGSEDCIKSCSCRRELHNNSECWNTDVTCEKVRRSEIKGPGPSPPRLHCRETTLLKVTWQCPGKPVFVVETRREGVDVWSPLEKTRKKMVTLFDAESFTKYQFRVTAFLPDGQLANASTSDWISTLDRAFEPGPVGDIRATNASLRPDGLYLQTTISWEPAWDRTCYYEAVCLSGMSWNNPVYIEEPEKFEYLLDSLKFGTKYNIFIMGKSKDRMRESNKSWFNFSTPLCLQYHQNDLTKCVPPKPSNVSVQEKELNGSQLRDVTVSWATPAVQPSFHKVELFRKIPEDYSILAQKNVTGNSTWVVFNALNVGLQYEVTVEAVSPAGPSERAIVIRTIYDFHANSNTSNSKSPAWSAQTLSLTLLPVVLLPIAAGIFVYVCHRRGKVRQHEKRFQYIETLDQKSPLRTEDCSSVEYDVDFDAKWEIPRENLLLSEVLGEGAFGIVRKGVVQEGNDRRDVAVKMLREKPSAEEVRQFRQEIIMMQSVGRHPNIVSLIGCCTSDDLLRLVVEYCAQGDLLNFLRKKWSEMMKSTERKHDAIVIQSETVKYAELLAQETTSEGESVNQFPGAVVNQTYGIENDDDSSQLWQELSPTDLLSFARQAAIGMEYLANNRVVHRDLAARNVLVCADRKVKISDFGLSRDIYEENVYHKKGSGRLPVRWMAPESLFRQVYNTQSDVWSFGILLWEIVTLGANPYPGIPTNKLPEYLREGHRMECPENCSNELYNIMFACWKAEPWQRPTFVELHKMLDDLLENSCPQKYLNLDIIDYMSELTFYQQEEQESRNNGSRYLISNMNRTTGPDDNIPASPFIEDRKHYLSTSIKTKYINTSSNVDEEKD